MRAPSRVGEYHRGMERIHYVDGSVLTGSAIAQALLGLAGALARKGSSATVNIPTRLDDGTIGNATFLLGPASQMVAASEPSPFPEIVDDDLVDSLDLQSNRLAVPRVEAADQPRAESIANTSPGLDEGNVGSGFGDSDISPELDRE